MENPISRRPRSAGNSNPSVLSLSEIYRKKVEQRFEEIKERDNPSGAKKSLVALFLEKRADLKAALQEAQQKKQVLQGETVKVAATLVELQPEQQHKYEQQMKQTAQETYSQAYPFPRPTSCFKTAEANSTQAIFTVNIPEGSVGFLEYISIYHPGNVSNLYVDFKIDGATIESYNSPLASIDVPLRYDPPWVVNSSVSLTIRNLSSKSHKCGGLLDGHMRRLPTSQKWQVIEGQLVPFTPRLLEQYELGE